MLGCWLGIWLLLGKWLNRVSATLSHGLGLCCFILILLRKKRVHDPVILVIVVNATLFSHLSRHEISDAILGISLHAFHQKTLIDSLRIGSHLLPHHCVVVGQVESCRQADIIVRKYLFWDRAATTRGLLFDHAAHFADDYSRLVIQMRVVTIHHIISVLLVRLLQ